MLFPIIKKQTENVLYDKIVKLTLLYRFLPAEDRDFISSCQSDVSIGYAQSPAGMQR